MPKEAIIVDNSSPDVVYSIPPTWGAEDNIQYYGGNMVDTNQPGASLRFSFDGVAIWCDCVSYTRNARANLLLRYYSHLATANGFYTVSIDGSEPERLNGRNDGGHLVQQMLWSKTDLTPGRHTFNLKSDDRGGTGYVGLDFFRSVTIEVTE